MVGVEVGSAFVCSGGIVVVVVVVVVVGLEF
jgi:hypothetical protein